VDRLSDDIKGPVIQLLLALADDKFILGHRNADWTGLAPILEEDIAFSSLAQDEIAHACTLYQMTAGLLGIRPDALAYGRKSEEYRCAQIVELTDEFDWATTICRNFCCDHFNSLRLQRMAQSAYTPLAQLAGRLVAEEQLHVDHVDQWVKRLGRGTDESHGRMQEALSRLSASAPMLLEPTEGQELLETRDIYPKGSVSLFDQWSQDLGRVAREAGLTLQLSRAPANAVGGRRGRHSDSFESLLDELTEVYRIEPEAAW
jgi:ring-1,2-phenylacetyl-CoA epoxidase subunit PaaC